METTYLEETPTKRLVVLGFSMRPSTPSSLEQTKAAAQSSGLRALNDARQALAETSSLQKIKEIRNRVEAIRQYAKAALLGLKLQNEAAELRLRAERKAGILLAGLRLRGGDRRSMEHERLTLRDLGITHNQSARWQHEAAVSELLFQQYLDDSAKQGFALTSTGLLRLARAGQLSTKGAAGVFDRLVGVLRVMASQGTAFGCIYADPPWHRHEGRRKRSSPSCSKVAAYLKSLPLRALAAPNAHLHLWAIPEALSQAMAVLEAWGFRYENSLVWVKTPGEYGRHWRQSHETLLLGVRGKLAFRDSSLCSCIADPDSSSPKSCMIRHLVERVSPGPYLDLFDQTDAPGWTSAAIEWPSR